MYTLLTEDLAEAARLLPPTPGPEKARVANIAAYTLLAKVYLTFGKPAEAKTALEEAMKNLLRTGIDDEKGFRRG